MISTRKSQYTLLHTIAAYIIAPDTPTFVCAAEQEVLGLQTRPDILEIRISDFCYSKHVDMCLIQFIVLRQPITLSVRCLCRQSPKTFRVVALKVMGSGVKKKNVSESDLEDKITKLVDPRLPILRYCSLCFIKATKNFRFRWVTKLLQQTVDSVSLVVKDLGQGCLTFLCEGPHSHFFPEGGLYSKCGQDKPMRRISHDSI